MQTKLFEIRDRATCISAMAIQFDCESDHERWIFGRSGYGRTREDINGYIQLTHLDTGESNYDPFKWSRTMREAHRHIIANWDNLNSCDVIDVEFILGESETKKISEYLGG